MHTLKKSLLGAAGIATIGGSILLGGAAANAANPTFPAYSVNQGGTVNVQPSFPWDTQGITYFTAPAGMTITGVTNAAGASATCTIAVDAKSGSCGFTNSHYSGGGFIFTLKAADDAAIGSHAGHVKVQRSASDGGAIGGEADFTVNVKPAAPTFSGVDNSSGKTEVNGTGTPGSTITVKDPAGNTIGAGTVGADGNYSVPLNKDYTGSTGDFTIVQTTSGVNSDPITVSGADLPVINPGIAVGALGMALLAGAGFVARRRLA